MNKLFLLALILNLSLVTAQTPCVANMAGSYPCDNLDLQSEFTYTQLGAYNHGSYGRTGNDSWGWTDPNDGKEYAIVGINNSTYFIDISDPVNPRRLGRMMQHTGTYSLWHDVKVYNNHAFVVSEQTNHGMQVFDLTRLRGLSTDANRTFSADAHYAGFGDAHNIIINENSGIAYILGARLYSAPGTNTVIFLDITNPTSPTLIDDYSGKGYTHDAQVVTYDGPDPDYQGKEIFIGANEDEIVILDVTNKSSVSVISTITYPNYHYTHQGWFTEDKSYFLLGDEEDEVMGGVGNTKTIVLDLIDLDAPSIHFNYFGPTPAIDHNGYVRGNRFYMASYRAGLRVMKVDDIANQNMTEVAYFDTYPSSNSANFNGAWNVYPFFESGNLIISNYDTGFQIVKDPNYDNTDPVASCQNITATLDKTTGTVTITPAQIDNGSTDNIGIVSMSLTGQTSFTCADIGDHNVTFTVLDDYGNESSCVATVTIEAETTQFLAPGVWTNGDPQLGTNAKISFDYDTAIVVNPDINTCTCEIDTGITMTIQDGNFLNSENNIDVNGTLIVKHQGSVVQTDPDATVTKHPTTGTINVELTTPLLKKRDFMVMGSPMDLETRNDVFSSAFLVLQHTPANFIPHAGVPAGGTNFADDNGDFWNQIAAGPITVGEGYIVRPQSGYNDPIYINPGDEFTFDMTYAEGTLNSGNVVRPVTFNGIGSNPDGTPNVLANPYASAIDANLLINDVDNTLLNEVYFWEHLTSPSPSIPGANAQNFSMDDISMHNGTMGIPAANDPGTTTTPNGVISTGQGFGIKAFGNGNVTFKNSMRLNTGNSTLRTPQGLEKLTLKIANEEFGLGGYAGIAFSSDATAGLDTKFDSNRLATFISLYSQLVDVTEQLGIQTREAFDSEIKIPLGYASQVAAETSFTISLANVEGENLSNVTIYLYDNQEDVLTNLSTDVYEFKSNKGQFDGRFTLSFDQDDVLGPPSGALQSVIVYPNPTDEIINIFSPATFLTSIEVYDTRGRRLSEEIDKEQNEVAINVSSLETGIYFVTIDTEVGSITKKIIKK